MMFAMVACSYDDVTMPHEVPTDGTTLLNFSVQVPDMQQATRSMASQAITKLDLVVFDEQGYFVEKAVATLIDANAGTSDSATPVNPGAEQKYSVELLQSAAPRIIHFIANSPVDSYSYGSERELINALETSGSADAYWQRIELNSILGDVVSEDGKVTASPDSELAQALNQIPLVRNFAKVTVTKAETVTDAIFGNVQIAVYNAPQRGKVAPYNTNAGAWANYRAVPSYTTLTTAKYYGYEATGLGSEDGDFANTGFADVQYLYEYNMDGKNITAGSKYPFVIIAGSYLGHDTSYYKVDLVDADGDYYNILRNFNYNVIIDKVSGDGYPTAEAAAAAAASNNISASIDTRNLLNISDGVSRLYVEYTSKYITTTEPVTLKYKFVPNINNSNTVDNDYVLTGTPTTTNPVDLTKFVAGTVIGSFKVANADVDGWRTITITPTAISGTKEQEVVIGASTLSRTVRFVSQSAYPLAIDCPDEVPASVGTSMVATLTIPQNLPEAIFPLEFVIVSDKLSISPDATVENMPVKTNLKANGQEGGQFFGFVKTLEYEDYAVSADGNITYNTSIDCHFKTSIAASASTVSVYNPYFTAASDSFTNFDPKLFINYSLSGNVSRYGAGQTGTLRFTAASASDVVTVTLTGLERTSDNATEFTLTGSTTYSIPVTTTDWGTKPAAKLSADRYADATADADRNILYIPAGSLNAGEDEDISNRDVYLRQTTNGNDLTEVEFSSSGTNSNNATATINNLAEGTNLYLRYQYRIQTGTSWGRPTYTTYTYIAETTAGEAASTNPDDIIFNQQ